MNTTTLSDWLPSLSIFFGFCLAVLAINRTGKEKEKAVVGNYHLYGWWVLFATAILLIAVGVITAAFPMPVGTAATVLLVGEVIFILTGGGIYFFREVKMA